MFGLPTPGRVILWIGADWCATCSGRVLGFDAAMNFDAFISYASKDKPTADAVCAALEDAQIRCWIAPRDILPGADWSASIIDALDQCRVMILIFSGNANNSPAEFATNLFTRCTAEYL